MADPILVTVLTADGTVLTGKGYYYGCRVASTASAGSAIVYDNTAASGTVIDDVRALAAESRGEQFKHGVRVATGIHVDLTNAEHVTVWYSKSPT